MSHISKANTVEAIENNAYYIGCHISKLVPTLESNAISMGNWFGVSKSDQSLIKSVCDANICSEFLIFLLIR